MDRFIDSACVTEDNLFAGENDFDSDWSGSKGSRNNRRGKMKKNGNVHVHVGSNDENVKADNDNGWGFAQRQIAHAYKEHSTIIESLRRELDASKTREKALVEEFSKKFQQLHQKSPATFEALKTNLHTKSNTEMPFDDEDMPMDEMADTARMERTVRTMEHLKQKRIMDEFKRAADKELTQLRQSNQLQIRNIENELRSKVAEIDKLKKDAQTVTQERNFYKKAKEDLEKFGSPANMGNKTARPLSSSNVISPGESSIGTNSTTSPVHSFNINNSPSTDSESEGISPMRKITPLQRLRASNARKCQDTSRGSTPSTVQISPITMTPEGSNSRGKEYDSNEHPATASRLTKLFDTMSTPNLNALEKIAHVIDLLIDEKNASNTAVGEFDFSKDDKENQSLIPDDIHLETEERQFVQSIHNMFNKSLLKHVDLIDSLKTELKETNMELQEGASKASKIMKDLNDRNHQITELENELDMVKDSARNTQNLKDMLHMVADDQKTRLVEFSNLRDKLKAIEEERDVLIQEKSETQQESDKAIAAIQRVMADGAAQHESVLEEYELKIKTISNENALLKKKLDPTYDALGSEAATVTVKQEDWDSMNKDAKKCISLAEEIAKIKNQLDEARTRNEELEADMEISKEEARDLNEKLDESKSIIKQLELQVTAQFEDLEAENADMSALIDDMKDELKLKQDSHEKMLPEMIEQERTISALISEKESLEEKIAFLESEIALFKQQSSTATEVLRTAKNVHVREQKLEDELSDLRVLFEKEIAGKAILRKEITSLKIQQAKLKSLRMEVIEMKEEKLALKTRVREVETLLERSNRIMSLMQETSDTEGTARQAIVDLKDQLKEEQELHHELRRCCDKYGLTIVEKLSQKAHTTLCLLETGVLGVTGECNASAMAMFDFSKNTSPKEQLLEKSLMIQRTENERIRKNIAEINSARDEESKTLRTQLKTIKADLQTKLELLEKKEEEIIDIQELLEKKEEAIIDFQEKWKDSALGYISGDDSDCEDDEEGLSSPTNLNVSVHVSKKSTDEEIAKMCQELQEAKEKAEREAKEKAESLANAKMIISSIETSNKKMVSDLKSRLHDSNAAIVSLLDQASKREKDSAQMKAEIEQLRTAKREIETQLDLLSSTAREENEIAEISNDETKHYENVEQSGDEVDSDPLSTSI